MLEHTISRIPYRENHIIHMTVIAEEPDRLLFYLDGSPLCEYSIAQLIDYHITTLEQQKKEQSTESPEIEDKLQEEIQALNDKVNKENQKVDVSEDITDKDDPDTVEEPAPIKQEPEKVETPRTEPIPVTQPEPEVNKTPEKKTVPEPVKQDSGDDELDGIMKDIMKERHDDE